MPALLENDVAIEIKRRSDHPQKVEGEVFMKSCLWDEELGSFIAEWSDGICQYFTP